MPCKVVPTRRVLLVVLLLPFLATHVLSADQVQLIKARIQADPSNWRGYQQLGIAYHNGQRYAEAVAAFEQALALHPAFQEIDLPRSGGTGAGEGGAVFEMMAKMRGADPESVSAFRAGLASVPGPATALGPRPVAALPKLAGKANARERRELGQIYGSLGATLLAQQRFEDAVASFEKSLAFDPALLASVRNLGVCYDRLGWYAAAIAALNRFAALAPSPDPDATATLSDAQRSLGLVQPSKDTFDVALKQFRELVARRPDDVNVLNGMGYACFERGHYREAVDAYESSLMMDMNQSAVARRLGVSQYLLGHLDEALGALGRAVAMAPEDGTSRMWLGLVQEAAGDAKAAQESFKAAVAKYRGLTAADRPPAFVGVAYTRLGQPDLAKAWLTAATEAHPLDRTVAYAYWGLALAHEKSGRIPQALDALQLALELDPRAGYVRRSLAQLVGKARPKADAALARAEKAEGSRRAEEAVAAYSEAVRLAPADLAQHKVLLQLLKLAAGLPQPPKLPPEAQRHTLRARRLLKSAKGPLDFERARLAYRAALVDAPWSAVLHLDMAMASALRGRYGDALRHFELYAKGDPKAENTDTVAARLRALEEGYQQALRSPSLLSQAREEDFQQPAPRAPAASAAAVDELTKPVPAAAAKTTEEKPATPAPKRAPLRVRP